MSDRQIPPRRRAFAAERSSYRLSGLAIECEERGVQVTCASFDLCEPVASTESLRRLSTVHVIDLAIVDAGVNQIIVLVLLAVADARAIALEDPPPAALWPSLSNSVCRLAHKLGGYLRICFACLLTSQLNISVESREAK
jgi:hypothetical protein